jgi:hypothetical protein
VQEHKHACTVCQLHVQDSTQQALRFTAHTAREQ